MEIKKAAKIVRDEIRGINQDNLQEAWEKVQTYNANHSVPRVNDPQAMRTILKMQEEIEILDNLVMQLYACALAGKLVEDENDTIGIDAYNNIVEGIANIGKYFADEHNYNNADLLTL